MIDDLTGHEAVADAHHLLLLVVLLVEAAAALITTLKKNLGMHLKQ